MRRHEHRRKLLHIFIILFALLLRYLNYWQYALLVGGAVILVSFILPRLGLFKKHLYREEEDGKMHSLAMTSYTVGVFLVVLIFPLPIAAAAWAIMAIGDGFAGWLGQVFEGKKLFWNKKKTYLGLTVFIVTAFPVSAFFYWFTQGNTINSASYILTATTLKIYSGLSFTNILIYSLIATVIAAMVETLPLKAYDNLILPLIAGATLWGLIII